MEATAPTAREQFVSDYTLVVDNNSEAYFETIDLVRAKKESTRHPLKALSSPLQQTRTQTRTKSSANYATT